MWNGGSRAPQTGSPFCSLFWDAGWRQGGEGRGWSAITIMWHSLCSWLTRPSSPSCERCWRAVETALLRSSQHYQCSASRQRLINHWHVICPIDTSSWVAHVWQWLHCLLGIVKPLLWHWGNLFAGCFPLPKLYLFHDKDCLYATTSLGTAIPWDEAGLAQDWKWGFGKRNT